MFSISIILSLIFLSLPGNEGGGIVHRHSIGNPIYPLIVGGTPAANGEFPYQVSLQANDHATNTWTPFCGGVLISPSHILTAAHCKYYNNQDYFSMRAVAGEVDLQKDSPTRQEVLVNLDKIYTHPDWSRPQRMNDIAVFELFKPFNMTNHVKPIALPSPTHVPSGFADVSGWGSTVDGGENVAKLQKANIEIFSDQFCRDKYKDEFRGGMLCAGSLDGSKDACQGDAGSALASVDEGKPLLVGMVSYGHGCGKAGQLGFYMKVPYFVGWIKSHT